jgi:methanogenic corrinoid protein MtbC1
MDDILTLLLMAVEAGKVDYKSVYPQSLQGQDGAYEITARALQLGYSPQQLLDLALVPAMQKVGERFAGGLIFVPQMLMAAKAMGAAMVQLKPFFRSGEVLTRGTLIIGTVKGDLHDIGKNLAAMMAEGHGWQVVDLGVDVRAVRFIEALQKYPDAFVGLSALLTTTMVNMSEIVLAIRQQSASTQIIIGGAPVSSSFCDKIGADYYAPDPQSAIDFMHRQISGSIQEIN